LYATATARKETRYPGDHLPQRVSDYAKWLGGQPERQVAVGGQHDGVADDALTERSKPDVAEPNGYLVPALPGIWATVVKPVVT
jgi:hypothetical protein